jgi:hypothetical protein
MKKRRTATLRIWQSQIADPLMIRGIEERRIGSSKLRDRTIAQSSMDQQFQIAKSSMPAAVYGFPAPTAEGMAP